MSDNLVSRRDFVRGGVLATASVAAGLIPTYTVQAGNPNQADTKRIVNYNPNMEYRRCGKTDLMISVICLGGHWKRIDQVLPGGRNDTGLRNANFVKNRQDVVSRCIDSGINYIDACTGSEVMAYSQALRGRRDKMYLGYSWYEKEMRFPNFRRFEALRNSLEEGLKAANLEYVDLWRITLHEGSSRHTGAEIDEFIKTLEWAKKSGKVRFTGFSSHDRPHIKKLIEDYPRQVEAVCTPYTARTRVVTDESGLWAAMRKHDVGWFGIKPFASNSVFRGNGSPNSEHAEEDNKIARMALRHILCNPAITAPIPGLISRQQVDNAVLAVRERRELDTKEKAELDKAMDRAWANLPREYQWLKNWDTV